MRNRSFWLWCLFALPVLLAGCTKHETEEEPEEEPVPYIVNIKASDYMGGELTGDEVTEVKLFLFDGNNHFLRQVDTRVGESVSIEVPPEGLQLVSWGNLTDGRQHYTIPTAGMHVDDCFVELLPHTLSQSTGYSLSPGTLFRGSLRLAGKLKPFDTETLTLYRQVGSLAITIRRSTGTVGYFADDFRVVVRETFNRISFAGELQGTKTGYLPEGEVVLNAGVEEYHIPSFNILPSEKKLFVDIYRGGERVVTVEQDSGGNPIQLEAGRLTNVLIDLKELPDPEPGAPLAVGVSVVLTAWGEEVLWKSF